jgi:CheY-like chemotaxis protein
MNGYEVAKALKAEATLAGARLIALSGYAAPEDIARAKAAGFDDHLAKPASLAAINRVLQGG